MLVLFKKTLSLVSPKKYVLESSYGYRHDIYKKWSKNCFFAGHWQSEKYFSEIRDDILRQFEFRPFSEPKNIELAKKMMSENSVAIHVRKGADYQFAPRLCDMKYYRAAVEYIRSRVADPQFYVFTDNSLWVQRNFTDIPYTLVDWNDRTGAMSFRDMQLMTCAKHNIIANSSYSWWGAWLNRNADKIVTAPKLFFLQDDGYYSTADVVCDDWVKF